MRAFRIAAILVLLASLAVAPAHGDGRGAVATPAGTAMASATVARVERGIRECVNRNRRAAGLPALTAAGPLNRAARLHARNMAREGFFDHTDPRGRGPAERVAVFDRAGRFPFVGENIGAGHRSAAAACSGWMNSSGHRRNILERAYTHVGAGFARGGPYGRYYVQVFATIRLGRSGAVGR